MSRIVAGFRCNRIDDDRSGRVLSSSSTLELHHHVIERRDAHDLFAPH